MKHCMTGRLHPLTPQSYLLDFAHMMDMRLLITMIEKLNLLRKLLLEKRCETSKSRSLLTR